MHEDISLEFEKCLNQVGVIESDLINNFASSRDLIDNFLLNTNGWLFFVHFCVRRCQQTSRDAISIIVIITIRKKFELN